MLVRLLKTADAESYWALRLEALRGNPDAFVTSYKEAIKRKDPVKQVVKNLNADCSFTFGAFDHGQLIGMLTLIQEKHLKLQHRANIFAMYVKPAQRNSGVGGALLLAAIEKANTIEALKQINLSVVSTNENAKRLYMKHGFQVFGMEEKAIKIDYNYYDEEHMVLFL